MHGALMLCHLPSLAALRITGSCANAEVIIYIYLYLGWHSVDWLYVGKKTNKRWALVDTVMNLQVP